MGEIGIVCREAINRVSTGIALPLPVPQSPCLCGVSATIANAEYKLLLLLISNVIFYK
jgi:hypothetical protein